MLLDERRGSHRCRRDCSMRRGAAPPMLNHHHSWSVLNHSHSVYMSTFILLQLYTFILLTLHPLYNTLHHIIREGALHNEHFYNILAMLSKEANWCINNCSCDHATFSLTLGYLGSCSIEAQWGVCTRPTTLHGQWLELKLLIILSSIPLLQLNERSTYHILEVQFRKSVGHLRKRTATILQLLRQVKTTDTSFTIS